MGTLSSPNHKLYQQPSPVTSGWCTQTPSPVASGVPPSPVTSGVPPSPVTSGVPPSPVTSGVPPSPVTSGVPPSPVTSGVPPSPVTSGVPVPPSPVTSGVPPPSPVTSGVPPPSPVTSGVPPPSPVTSGVPPPSPVTSVDNLAAILSLSEDDGKEGKRQALRLVLLVKSQSMGLVSEYLHFQGPPFSDSGFNLEPQVEGLPTPHDLPASPWKRLSLCFSAFLSLTSWFAAVVVWQQDLNPKAEQFHKSLMTCQKECRALSSSLAALLGRTDLAFPQTPVVPKIYAKKVAGYAVCFRFLNWLDQAEKDLVILIAETAV
ncbi:cardiotrophin-2-like [Pelodytes ibericus]